MGWGAYKGPKGDQKYSDVISVKSELCKREISVSFISYIDSPLISLSRRAGHPKENHC